MSNLQARPVEIAADPTRGAAPTGVHVLRPREVPLGGPRAMTVRRTLPQRDRTFVGAWCFADHYGPDDVARSGGMRVPPHPHTGLATVSWLFAGEIEHRDSAGHHALVRPGELNLMTAGRGISHSEVSTAATTVLHGVQLWIALPDAARFTEPHFEHHVPDGVTGPGWRARVFLGAAFGRTSPIATHSPLLGAELELDPGGRVEIEVDPAFEHGLLVDAGPVTVGGPDGAGGVGGTEGVRLHPGELGHLAPGRRALRLAAGDAPVRLLLLGGTPFTEPILMWWNFVGRTHEEIAGFRADWEAGRFALPPGDPLPPLPAPVLPTARLRPRGLPSPGER